MRFGVLLLLLLPLGCGREPAPRARIRLATTTSTENSGLLAEILPPFEQGTGIAVQVLAVGTGQALALGARGDADVVLVHAREQEDRFIADGHGTDRRDVMWNDFVVAGPAEDPAEVRGRPIAEALARIRERGAKFVSRADDSGTHLRETALWTAAGGAPRGAAYLEAGQGMGRCLVIADEKRAYLLVDRGTFLAFRRRLSLVVLVEGDAELKNPYGAILVRPPRPEARELLDYLCSEEGRRRIAAFRVDGEALFHPAGGGG